ncbi:hypothetical protein OB955_24975 [Halobacteria archaeon AArc-m2/3/4]|uniref:Uncharacterized protein n=1 Tax=Natronoglomus mannanivorans TaxID=2979990 RepID=A0ABT2QM28_9EURY|nr:hypothetical protein [Halobacteria archaeon AArc-m2/3/4]
MSSSDDYLDRGEGTNPASAMMSGISGAIYAVFGGLIMLISSAFDGLADLMDVFAASRDFFVALISEPTTIISAGARQTVYSITAGDWAFFGPGTFMVAIVSIALAWAAWAALDPEIPLVDDLIPWR